MNFCLSNWVTPSALLGGILISTLPIAALPAQVLSAPDTPIFDGTAAEAIAQSMSYTARAEQFVDLIFSAQYGEALEYLHPILREATAENSLEARVERFQQVTGLFQERRDARAVENVVLITTEFEHVTDTIVIIFDESGLITGVDFPLQPLQTIEE
ncbi:hypothetical protein [Egbenema bharatensis]|uniref:hypothetical protein n=1 Tax=Egbenema bharatensis TaxID=3463334 RepID=UPI003A893B20